VGDPQNTDVGPDDAAALAGALRTVALAANRQVNDCIIKFSEIYIMEEYSVK
jgi:hypothetical protein